MRSRPFGREKQAIVTYASRAAEFQSTPGFWAGRNSASVTGGHPSEFFVLRANLAKNAHKLVSP